MSWWVGSVAWKNRSICWNMNTFENRWSIWRNGGLCPMKAPEGHSKRFTHSSFGAFIQRTETFSSITFGLVSVMSLKCLLKMYLVNSSVVLIYLYMSLAVMLLGRYLIPTIVFTWHSSAIKCTVRWWLSSGLYIWQQTHSFLLCSLIPEVTCLHRTFLRAKLDIPEYVPKSFPELQLTWMQ